MAPPRTSRGKGPKQKHDSGRTLKRKRGEDEITTLAQKVEELDLKTALKNFSDLPLSDPTARGLTASHFKTLTDIQSRAISHALKGRDILGAAKTGSGKTLAFLVPVLENLYRRQWTEYDGLGALILAPTRELAIQIFEVLRKVGRYHAFSAGLVIGGKSLREEQERLGRMNILVCTPGRMLQHLDQTAMLETNNLQLLVMDEADRILDMGFQKTVDAIVDHLPKERQTMLFSATQTKKVGDLARLSLQDPEYVAVHETAAAATPSTLQQHYTITPLATKLDVLWSFIRSNLKSKTVVFLSSGKQVRFVYESFRHLQPGIPLMHLHGKQKQGGRLDITTKFSQSQHAVLFATDVAARGLDFPAVDWVIQVDCPEDSDTYIHRVGRTARYERVGRAVLFLDPSEEKGMLKRLEQKKVPIEKINIKAAKQQSIKNQLQNMCFKDPELKYLGQKAFISYVKSIYVQKDKEIFNLKELKLEDYAASLGLPGAPRIKFIKGDDTKERKNASWKMAHLTDSEAESGEEGAAKKDKKDEKEVRTRYDRMFERRNQDVLAGHYSKLINDDGTMIDSGAKTAAGEDADEDADFLSVKRVFAIGDENLGKADSSDSEASSDGEKDTKVVQLDGKNELIIDSKRREKLLKSKKKLLKFKGKGTRLVYDDEGNAHEVYEMEDEEGFKARGDADTQRERFLAEETERTRRADLEDKEVAREKRREKKEKRKARERALAAGEAEDDEEGGVPHGLPFVPFEIPGSDSGSEAEEKEEASRPSKKQRVTFAEPNSDSEEDPRQKRTKGKKTAAQPQIETLADLEELASGLLG
ncbi:ATP-dependent RNA helicase dbp4 [Penicillium subrubescens]|uniref:ATP-dependent RNA helicase n=1 Tax=Penicillium subrubescens TaxID=1316194 RepID=A0A1Q5TQQ0_9EURO|nr:ATP-dependent RNA helicase dbp4 [Penicillium subrubescens]KAJ5900517.1 ATP-dependent RNA helicase dbp4 [Penicillium subrubescens]OKP02517.1 ATP-dependent RNA helicase dbp4 [Penicillium subrubescens]